MGLEEKMSFKERLSDAATSAVFGLTFAFCLWLFCCVVGAGLLGIFLLLNHFMPHLTGVLVKSLSAVLSLVIFYYLFWPVVGLLIFLLAGVLSIFRRRGSEYLPTPEKSEVIRALAELYIDSQTEKNPDPEGLIYAIRKSSLKKQDIQKILDTEVAPVFFPLILNLAFAMEDALEGPVKMNWLIAKISARTWVFNFIRSIPVVGFLWSRLSTKLIRDSVSSALFEVYDKSDTSYPWAESDSVK